MLSLYYWADMAAGTGHEPEKGKGVHIRPNKGSKPVTHLTSLAGVDTVVEAAGFVATYPTEDSRSVEFCGQLKKRESRKKQSQSAIRQKESVFASSLAKKFSSILMACDQVPQTDIALIVNIRQ